MDKRPILNNDDFIMLRSLWHERHVCKPGSIVRWRHNNRWWYVRQDGHATSIDTEPTKYTSLLLAHSRAIDALERLERYGLVHETQVRCCPGTGCHANDSVVFTLTAAGYQGISRIDNRPSPLPTLPTQPEPTVPSHPARSTFWQQLRRMWWGLKGI